MLSDRTGSYPTGPSHTAHLCKKVKDGSVQAQVGVMDVTNERRREVRAEDKAAILLAGTYIKKK